MNLNQAKNFLKKLNADGLMYHLEDCAVDCLHETNNVITKKQAREIQKKVDSIYESDLDWGAFGCPIGYCLHLMKLENINKNLQNICEDYYTHER